MTWISDDALLHLRGVTDEPDLSGTRYRLVGRLGRGGMGTVYRAEDAELGRDVALKVLAVPDTDAALAARILAEARILARLEHPGIVPVHDVGRLPDGRVFYVMKRVDGTRLDHHPTGSATDALRIVRRICDTLAFAHANGIVHRDLKPENVMVGAFGEVLVLDWGVAKVLHDAGPRAGEVDPPAIGGARAPLPRDPAGVTAAGERLGTPGWMAPEQTAAEPGGVDARADVFGAGALLFFLLTRLEPVLPGDAERDPAAAHDDRVRTALRRLRPTPHRRLRAIIARALAYAPANRYPAVEALAADLDRFLDGASVEAHRENPWERTAAFVSRYRTPIALVLSYIVMRVLLILFAGP